MVMKKSPDQIARMREAGIIVWQAHQAAAQLIEPGVTTAEIDAVVEQVIERHGGRPLFKGVLIPGAIPFPAATCISINHEVVHGIPGPRRIQAGDVVSVDIGVELLGWCGDAATTYAVAPADARAQRLVEVTEGALRLAIACMHTATYWNEVAGRMEQAVDGSGFTLVDDLGGHGIGRAMWEAPQVPNRATRESRRLALEPGLVIAVEQMVATGSPRVRTAADRWTVVTEDGLPSAHFEHTIAFTDDGPLVLTAGPDGSGWALS